MTMRTITVKAPVNIAVIKYWGKKDEELIIPLNDSISGTLSMDQLCATTSVAIGANFTAHRMWLNGDEVCIESNKRLVRCLNIVKQIAGDQWPDNHFVHICSRNNFPTAAGLASSAAGYACLMFALCQLFGIHDCALISTFARLGSGSACRSIYGGFVQWITGDSMETSVARQIIDENAWPQIRVLVLVVNDQKKDVSSTSGMQLTVQTSSLIGARVTEVVPKHIEQMLSALKRKDFHTFAEVTMKDSNQFHAVCLDTYPPIRYMNDISWLVVNLVHLYNRTIGENVVCYTYDAGPNACLYCLQDHVPNLLSLISRLAPPSSGKPLEINGIQYNTSSAEDKLGTLDPSLVAYVDKHSSVDALKYIISTKIGSGPMVVTQAFDDDNSLLDQNGMPKQ